MIHQEVLVITDKNTSPKILNWKVSTVDAVETAIEKLQYNTYKIIALSNSLPRTEKSKLKRITTILFENTIVVKFSNNLTLPEKINRAYWSKNKPKKNYYLDNSFEIKLASSINLN